MLKRETIITEFVQNAELNSPTLTMIVKVVVVTLVENVAILHGLVGLQIKINKMLVDLTPNIKEIERRKKLIKSCCNSYHG